MEDKAAGSYTRLALYISTTSQLAWVIPEFTFNAKGGSLRGLSDTSKHIELHVGSQGLHQTDGGGALSFAQRGGRNAADKRILVSGGKKQLLFRQTIKAVTLAEHAEMLFCRFKF